MFGLKGRSFAIGVVLALYLGFGGFAAPGQAQTYTWPANGHTYVLINQGAWVASNGYAKGLGGYLVSVESAEEQEMLQSVFSGTSEYWIGCYIISGSTAWAWASNEAVAWTDTTYTNWG